ncbi:MAG: hypothetical protein M0Q38_00925 [Bacteroidales bacterium]|nr:hypothetical protein [Bacteroidales bacterium]
MEEKVFTPSEYCKKLKKEGKTMSTKILIRRRKNNQLPSNTTARVVGRTWIIFVGFE